MRRVAPCPPWQFVPSLLLLQQLGVAAVAAAASSIRDGSAKDVPHTSSTGNTSTVQLFLLPHTHADVGWLELPEALARMNVSRILSGVVGNLANDTSGRRRFVWDEMYFLHW